MTTPASPAVDLSYLGLRNLAKVHHNLSPAVLNEIAVIRGEGSLASNGALVVRTGKRTGRSPKDKFLVDEPSTTGNIWWGPVNQKMSQTHFDRLFTKAQAYVNGKELFVFDGFAGADPKHRLAVRV